MQSRSPRRHGFHPWIRKKMATHSKVFLPGEFHRQRSPEGYNPWSRQELNMAEWLTLYKASFKSPVFQEASLNPQSVCLLFPLIISSHSLPWFKFTYAYYPTSCKPGAFQHLSVHMLQLLVQDFVYSMCSINTYFTDH